MWLHPRELVIVLLQPLAYIVHNVWKCYYKPWHISYTIYGSVNTTPGIYRTPCMEVLLQPLAYIVHNVWKCYYNPWHISYTMYGSVTTTPGIYRTRCMEVLLQPVAYIVHNVWQCYYNTWHISYTMYGSAPNHWYFIPLAVLVDEFLGTRRKEMSTITRPTNDDGSTTN